MKRLRFLAIAILVFSCSLLFAVDYHQDQSVSRLITAYKATSTGSIPHLAVSIRLLDVSQNEFQNNGNKLSIPDTSRGMYYGAFSWVLAGNAFQNVQVSFSFGPMTLNNEEPSDNTEIIPYSVKLVYGASRIGNSSIQINTTSTADAYVENSFSGTTYRFKYADSISPSSNISNDLSSATEKTNLGSPIVITYNMYTNTKVYNTEGQDTYREKNKTKYYKDLYTTNVSVQTQDSQGNTVNVPAVCDYWNRTGTAYVKLNITSDGKIASDTSVKLKEGWYYATVVVEVSLT